jgi:AraC-like DNA-binding protein
MYNSDNSGPSDFSRELYIHCITNRDITGAPSVAEIADNMGWSEDLVYKILRGERHLSVEDFPRFYRFSGKPVKALLYFIHKCEKNALVSLNGGDEVQHVAAHVCLALNDLERATQHLKGMTG